MLPMAVAWSSGAVTKFQEEGTVLGVSQEEGGSFGGFFPTDNAL